MTEPLLDDPGDHHAGVVDPTATKGHVRVAGPRHRALRRVGIVVVAVLAGLTLVLAGSAVALSMESSGTPSPSAHGTGNDAEWLGHAWVDGRKSQSDVDAMAVQLRGTGIRDLLVHAGPFRDDGTLDPALRPRAGWLVQALHTALPGVRVQAWLGAHPVPEHLRLDSAVSRAAVLASVGQVLDDGFDGIHYDFEPVRDGDTDLLTMLSETRVVTRQRHVVLSVSASHTEPVSVMAAGVRLVPRPVALWSGAYLHEVALRVDQVAVMAYDTGLPTEATYGGYVRRCTVTALDAVPADVTLLIGVPAYRDEHLTHHARAETVAAALHGIRLAMGVNPPDRIFGVAMYVDFTATADDWATYDRDWAHVKR